MKINTEYIDKILTQYIDQQFCSMREQVMYCLSSGGKRVRPLLLINMANAVDAVDSNIERLAVALELIHTYSLVHDDLPAMDNDDYRRGQLTAHKKFGEATAILTGDTLLNLSMEILTNADNVSENYFKAMAYLYQCSGAQGMIYGQVLDIEGNSNSSMERLDTVAINKTGRLLQASIVTPLIYFQQSEDIIDTAKAFGELLGKAYQLADDILDGEQCDLTSYLSIMSLDTAVNLLAQWTNSLIEMCDTLEQKLNTKLGFLRELVLFNSQRKK